MANWIEYTSKGIDQAQQVFGAITYHPATGYSTVRDLIDRPLFNTTSRAEYTIEQLARWLGTNDATALDWVVYKVAAFRGVSETEARAIVTGG